MGRLKLIQVTLVTEKLGENRERIDRPAFPRAYLFCGGDHPFFCRPSSHDDASPIDRQPHHLREHRSRPAEQRPTRGLIREETIFS